MKYLVLIFLFLFSSLHSQNNKLVKTDKDGIPIIWVKGIEIVAKAPTKSELRAAQRKVAEYHKLIYNVRKVYPYAQIASDIYKKIQTEVNHLDSQHDKHAYFKKREKELFARWEEELKNLTVSQGKLLVLLIDRQTSQTTYEIIKDLKSWRSALLWQTVARLFGSNLKEEYQPYGKHKEIEKIIREEFEHT